MDIVRARRKARRVGRSRVRSDDYFAFEGGLNEVDTPLKVQPGELIGCKNYEPGIRGGYARVEGFERYDGQLKPSDAGFVYIVIGSTTPANYPAVGATVTGLSSGATGVLLVDVTAAPAVVLGRTSVTPFTLGEVLQATGSFGTVATSPQSNVAPTDDEIKTYRLAAVADARAQIAVVPGAGPLRGVVRYNGAAYAFRDNVGQTTCVMHKESASGWQAVAFNNILNFVTGAGTEPSEGDTLTGLASSASAPILRIVKTVTTWAGTSGYFVLGTVTNGPFQDAEALQVSAATVATASGANAVPTLLPGGRYEFRVKNFYGHTSTRRLYGVDGVNKGFEYDDAGIFTPITTGMDDDTPIHVGIHQNELWLAFTGGSAQKSGVGEPLAWTAVTGAAEIAVGSEITGFVEEVGETLFIMTDDQAHTVTGRTPNYVLDDYSYETGAAEWSLQRIGQGVYLDARGFASLASTDRYGNFAYTSFSNKVQKSINELRSLGVTASVISRTKNLYRCFFEDGRFVSIGFRGNKVTGITLCDYGIPVRCIDSRKDTTGTESILFGSDDGYVYEADRGTSFDGEAIEAFARLAFHFSRSPTRRKRYRQAAIDINTVGETTLKASIDYTFASPDEPGNPSIDISSQGGGGFWDIDNWDEFRWNTGVVATARFKLEGAGRNIGIHFYHNASDEGSHSLEGITLHHSLRRIDRSTNA